MKIAIEFDDKLYERVMKKRYNDSRRNASIFAKSVDYRRKESHFRNNIDNYDITFMKLNSTQRRKKINSKRNKKNNKNNKTCYSCDKSNHFAKNCRSKNLMQRRQINVTLKKDSDA